MRIRLFGEVRAIPGEIVIAESFRDAEVTVCNLETPVTDAETAVVKAGVSLKGKEADFTRFVEAFRGETQTGEKHELVLTLANNHMGDYGRQGVQDTVAACEKAGVKCGGVSVGNRQQPVMVETLDAKIAVFCVAERQFGLSRGDAPGVDFLSPGLYAKIRAAKEAGHFVILSVHAAAEMNLWPAPLWQETLRSFVDAGVDVVHGHHSRVPQGYETYKDSVIFYGLGNFLGPVQRWRRKRNALWGLCAEVEVRDGVRQNFRVTPLWLRETEDGKTLIEPVPENDVNPCVGELSGMPATEEYPSSDAINKYLNDTCRPLSDAWLLEALWQEFAMRMFEKHFAPLMGLAGVQAADTGRLSRLRNAFHTLAGHYEKFIPAYRHAPTPENYALWYHWFGCETHRLTAETAFGLLCGEIPDVRTLETRELLDKYFQMF